MICIAHKSRYESKNLKKYCIKEKRVDEDQFVGMYSDYGIVLETSYHYAEVLYKEKTLQARLGKEFCSICNQTVFPGDWVVLDDNYNIVKIIKRKNMLCREKHDGTKINSFGVTKVVAVNIDLAVIVVSAQNPPFHPRFIDRYLILLKSNAIPFLVVMNKCELKNEKEEFLLDIYRKIGITVIETSTCLNIGVDHLKRKLKRKQAIFVGHSGVGKSSLVNAIMSEQEAKVGFVGEKTGKGCHTTTTSKYYKWDENSSIIDTPGIRSLDISNFDPLDVQTYFAEINKFKGNCKYKDCLHFDENLSDCYVKQKVYSGEISVERYESYVKLIEELLKNNPNSFY